MNTICSDLPVDTHLFHSLRLLSHFTTHDLHCTLRSSTLPIRTSPNAPFVAAACSPIRAILPDRFKTRELIDDIVPWKVAIRWQLEPVHLFVFAFVILSVGNISD